MFRKDRFLFLLAAWLLLGPRSFAHPMGNFSVNHYRRFRSRATVSGFPTSSIWLRSRPTRSCSRVMSQPMWQIPRSRVLWRRAAWNWVVASACWSTVSVCLSVWCPAR